MSGSATQDNPKRDPQDAGTGAHWPIERQMTSADQAEADALAGEGKPVLAPQPYQQAQDPDLDPNVRRGGPASTAGPARTETTRDAALAADLVVEADPASPATATSLNSARPGTLGEDVNARNDRIREANAKKASAPNTVSSAAMQDDSGKTKPEFKHTDKAEAKAKAKAEADKNK